MRLAEYGTCYRYEQSGELFGLMRVRSLNMNDAHIYCTEEQFADEFRAVNDMYLKYFKIFGLEKYQMRFSTHSAEGLGKKYVNEPELWKKTEDMVRKVLIESGINYMEVANEAAFYGPKIDVQVWSAIGREFTIATNQVDFAVPAKFGLTYRDKDNSNKTPLCIHRAPLGTHERFIGFLIEHYAGNFPLWLAPDQVRVITIGDDEALVNYSKQIVAELRAHEVRADGDYGSEPMKAKIAEAEKLRVHTMLVIGGRDMEAGAVSLRSARQRQCRRETESRGDRGYCGGDQRAQGMKVKITYYLEVISSWCYWAEPAWAELKKTLRRQGRIQLEDRPDAARSVSNLKRAGRMVLSSQRHDCTLAVHVERGLVRAGNETMAGAESRGRGGERFRRDR